MESESGVTARSLRAVGVQPTDGPPGPRLLELEVLSPAHTVGLSVSKSKLSDSEKLSDSDSE